MVDLKPLWKWPGGKRRYAALILRELDAAAFERYHEPFVGGGGVLWALLAGGYRGSAFIGDANPRLTACYQWLAESPIALHDAIAALPARPDGAVYLETRAQYNAAIVKSLDSAARLIWLQGHGFNGLYRENRKGEYNAPYGGGHQAGPRLDPEEYAAAGAALRRSAIIVEGAYRAHAPVRAAVYCDPPYVGGFSEYTGTWTEEDRAGLARWARDAADHGCRVGISDRMTPESTASYGADRVVPIDERHTIGAGNRKSVAPCALFIMEPTTKDGGV